jgi:pyruvate formate lyase activating enzyme
MGRIQSLQSFSTLDGPGTRCVVFFQGCPAGCLFCHNPESWAAAAGEEITPETLLLRLERFRPFLQEPPGLTLSGGEPLYQPEFALALAKLARRAGWHVALDTCGWGPITPFAGLVQAVDLVMFSIKHPLHPEALSKLNPASVLANWAALASFPTSVWLRYVLIKGWTDLPEALTALGKLARDLPTLEKIELFPYHSLAESDWAKLGRDSPLFHEESITVTEAEVRRAEAIVQKASGLPARLFPGLAAP